MDDAHAVGAREAVRELRGEVHEPADGQGTVREDLPQGLSRDELHREIRHAGGLPDLVDRDDARMVQRRSGARLLAEPDEALAILEEMGGQDLQGHVAAQPRVLGAIDLAHRSRAQGIQDLERTDARSGSEGH